MATKKSQKTGSTFVGVDALKHADDKRKNIPTAEYQSLMADEARKPVQVTYPRSTSNADHLKAEKEARNHDLDPQLIWRGKDAQDSSPLNVPTVTERRTDVATASKPTHIETRAP